MTLEDSNENDTLPNDGSIPSSVCDENDEEKKIENEWNRNNNNNTIVPPTDGQTCDDGTNNDSFCKTECTNDDNNNANGEEDESDSNHQNDHDNDGIEQEIQQLSSEPTDAGEINADQTQVTDATNSPQKPDSTGIKPSAFVDTWDHLTKRDRPLTSQNLVHVIDYSMAMLGERICEAANENNFRESIKSFERTLERLQNSEIELGKRIASGNFADIYHIRSFQRQSDEIDAEASSTAHTIDQSKPMETVDRKKPNDYVVKVLRRNLLINPTLFATAAADFITEGTLLAAVNHPNILAIRGRSNASVEGFSSGKRDAVFFVLERVEGTLAHKINEWSGRLTEHGLFAKSRRECKNGIFLECVTAMADLASAMAYLHERRVIHRDISLGNVGVSCGEGKVKLLDFGLAKVLPPATIENERFLLTSNTGSVRYMAPEIGLKQPYNLKADAYSFAILLYEILTLEVLFTKWQSNEIFERVHHNQYRPRLSMFWSKQLRQLFKFCWSHDPAQRLEMRHVETILQQEVRDLNATNSNANTTN